MRTVPLERLLKQLVEKLQTAYGAGLVSVVLYGSAAAGDYQEKFSDINIICVLAEVGKRELAASEEVFRWWRAHGNPSPLLLTESEMSAAVNCFPIEFSDMQRRHRILAGKDVVTTLELDRSFYRAQVAHELRVKLLRLRQKAAGMVTEFDLLRRLLADSVSTFCVLFRHALELYGEEPGAAKREVIQRAASRFGIDGAAFEKLLDLREGKIKPRAVEPVKVLTSVLEGVPAVIEAVDRLKEAETRS